MASRLMRWAVALGLVLTTIAALLLPPGRVVRRAEGPLRSLGVALGWAQPADLDTERAYRRASEERARARQVFEEEVLVQYAWQVADALVDSLEGRVASEDRTILLSLDGDVGELDFGDAELAAAACAAGDLTLGRAMEVDLAGAVCEVEGAPAVRYGFELTESTPFVASVSSRSRRPRLRLDGEALDRPLFDAARSDRESAIAIVLPPGRYELNIFAQPGEVPGGAVLVVEHPEGVPLSPGASVGAASETGVYYRPLLEPGLHYALRLAPGVALLDARGLREGPGVHLVEGNEPRLVHVRSQGGASNLVEISEPLAVSGTSIDFARPVEWRPDSTGLATFTLALEDWRSIRVDVTSGDGRTPVPARTWVLDEGGAMEASPERLLPPGYHRIGIALEDVASGSTGQSLQVRLVCAAAAVPASRGETTLWQGPPECAPATGASTAWRLDLDEQRVVSADWDGAGRVVAYSMERSEFGAGLLWGPVQLSAGPHYLLATGEAARSIVIRDLGTPDEHWKSVFAYALDSVSAGSPRVAVGLALAPVPQLDVYLSFRSFPVLAGVIGGESVCLVVRPARAVGRFPRWDGGELGICGLYARFGRPGPAMERWLLDGGVAFGARPSLEDIQYGLAGEFEDRGPLGMVAIMPYLPFSAYTEACLEGDVPSCDRAWEIAPDPVTARTPLTSVAEFASQLPLYGVSSFMFARLRSDFGDDAFERFWAAEQPLDDAFEAAFEVPRAVWTHDFATDLLGTRTGRGSVLDDAILILLLVAALALGTARISVRRTVP